MNTDRTPQYIKLDERNHVEKPFLDQLAVEWGQTLILDYQPLLYASARQELKITGSGNS
jgi:hypothetical protein